MSSGNIFDMIGYMTIEEYIDKVYGDFNFLQQIFGRDSSFRKADDPVLSTTPGILTTMYGEAAWTNVHREMSAFAALPKVPWARDGIRVITADPSDKVTGIAENAALPDTVKPTWETYKLNSKWMLTNWEITEMARQHTRRNEGINLDVDLRREYTDIHISGLDEKLLVDAEAEAAGAGADRGGSDMYNLESLDRIISSDAEEDVFGGTYNHWYDPWGTEIDRDAGTTYDSVVLHNSGTDREISTDLLDELIRKCQDKGLKKSTSFFLTGRDTKDKIKALMQAQVRYVPVQRAQFSVNGVQTDEGLEIGPTVVSYNDIPIITDKNVPKDTGSRVYLIDTRYTRIRLMLPTMFLSTKGSVDWLQLDALKDLYAYLTVAEVECTRMQCQGKIRDLL